MSRRASSTRGRRSRRRPSASLSDPQPPSSSATTPVNAPSSKRARLEHVAGASNSVTGLAACRCLRGHAYQRSAGVRLCGRTHSVLGSSRRAEPRMSSRSLVACAVTARYLVRGMTGPRILPASDDVIATAVMRSPRPGSGSREDQKCRVQERRARSRGRTRAAARMDTPTAHFKRGTTFTPCATCGGDAKKGGAVMNWTLSSATKD